MPILQPDVFHRARQLVRRAWSLLRQVLSIRGLLQWTGWWEPVTAIVFSAALAIWSIIRGLPWPVTVALAVVVFAAVSVCWRAWTPAPGRRATRAAYCFTKETKANRIFAPRTLVEMCGEIARGSTSHARQTTAEQFHGLWIHVTGNVRDTLRDDGSDVVQVPLLDPSSESIQIALLLELKWRALVLNLRPGRDCIEANGRINDIGGNWVVLAPVQMLAYGAPDRMVRCDTS